MNGPLSREITRRGWLGVAALEDKVVQREVVEALNALRARAGARSRQARPRLLRPRVQMLSRMLTGRPRRSPCWTR